MCVCVHHKTHKNIVSGVWGTLSYHLPKPRCSPHRTSTEPGHDPANDAHQSAPSADCAGRTRASGRNRAGMQPMQFMPHQPGFLFNASKWVCHGLSIVRHTPFFCWMESDSR